MKNQSEHGPLRGNFASTLQSLSGERGDKLLNYQTWRSQVFLRCWELGNINWEMALENAFCLDLVWRTQKPWEKQQRAGVDVRPRHWHWGLTLHGRPWPGGTQSGSPQLSVTTSHVERSWWPILGLLGVVTDPGLQLRQLDLLWALLLYEEKG